VIYNPINDELFTAVKGAGAQLNTHRIRVSKTKVMSHSMIAASFSNREGTNIDYHTALTQSMLKSCSSLRQAGSAALDLANIACGRLDGYWATQLKPWDMAAGILLITEAGGMVSDFNKEKLFLKNGTIIAGTPRIYSEVYKIISSQTVQDNGT
jgi:myo-inositol-1(or 4)-monophosphatase